MNTLESRLENRLISYAQAIGMGRTEVLSMKLRPVMPGAQYTDVFGFAHANAYLYESEYQAGQAVCNLCPAVGEIARVAQHVEHPSPYTGDTTRFILVFSDVNPPTAWVQHETGLEILAAAAHIATLIAVPISIFRIFEAIRKKVNANVRAEETDRFRKNVCKIRLEVRTLDGSGKLTQKLVLSLDTDQQFNQTHSKLLQQAINSLTRPRTHQ